MWECLVLPSTDGFFFLWHLAILKEMIFNGEAWEREFQWWSSSANVCYMPISGGLFLPLRKIWVPHLGSWHSQLNGNMKFMFQVTTKQARMRHQFRLGITSVTTCLVIDFRWQIPNSSSCQITVVQHLQASSPFRARCDSHQTLSSSMQEVIT